MRGAALALVALLFATAAAAQTPSVVDTMYVNPRYDPARDPVVDVQTATVAAQASHRHILLEVGGAWCVWCHILDDYLATDLKARKAFAEAFVIVKVNYDQQHQNAPFLAAYPHISGYPAFIILNADGRYLASQDTGALELGRSYDEAKVIAFAEGWRRP